MKTETVTTVRQYQRAFGKRIPVKFKFKQPAVATKHGKYEVRVLSMTTTYADGRGGVWHNDVWQVEINGRRLDVPGVYRPSLPKPYGFVTRIALAKAVKATDALNWR